jgi:homoserine dehydrogenase
VRRVNVVLAGIGGVGRKLAELLCARHEHYARVHGADVRLVGVCGSRAGRALPEGLGVSDLDDLIPGHCGVDFLLNLQPDVLIEAGPTDIRTGQPGADYIGGALDRGIHAIVVSKGALVADGHSLRARAVANGAQLKVSGATAAALPTIDLLEYGLMGCAVKSIEGILNATTNYLLSAMAEDGVSLDAALKDAQQRGMAESDPRKDIEGWDTAAKLLILANFGLDASLSLEDITVEGIEGINPQTIGLWRNQGKVPKLIGRLSLEDGQYQGSVRVEPVSTDHVFALVTGKTKALRVHTDVMGEIISIGYGSGPTATAAAALKDLEHILKGLT